MPLDRKYDASSIEVIENLDAVRKRPGMYIGDTNTKGLHHLIYEILDNSLDEHLAGYAKNIFVILHTDNSVCIIDDGRGIPVGIHPKTKKTAVETVFTVLHAGGKFGGENSGYKISGGLHGVGASVVNALSEFLEVTIWRDKIEHRIDFSNGGSESTGLKEIKSTNRTGTSIKFKPDSKIFSSINFNSKTISTKLLELAYLNPGVRIIFDDRKNDNKHSYHFPEGILEYVEHLSSIEKKNKPISEPCGFTWKNHQLTLNVAFKYITADSENINTFVNNINTIEGGTHESAFKSALLKAVNEYIKNNKLQQMGKFLDSFDIREGLIAVVSVYLIEELLQFEGQTKSKLSSPKIRSLIENAVYENILHFLNQNKESALEIIKKAYLAKKARESAKKAREVVKELKNTKKKSFAGKLVVAQSKNANERELFIVEGDSAGGSAKLGRDRKKQAILPLKGKIINTEKANLKAILANEELSMIIYAIGGGLGNEFKIDKTNYGKIIIMTDADTDGAHIQTLLLTFFYRFMNELIDAGKIYIAVPPLFKVTNKSTKKFVYAWSNEELSQIKEKQKNIEVQRYKGLGEMNYEQLWETTMDPKTRTLIKVSSKNIESSDKMIETLMGSDPSLRRVWIENNVEFTLDDNFEEINKKLSLNKEDK